MTDQPSTELTPPHPPRDQVCRDDGALRTGWYERVTSFFTALILLLGSGVALLAILWVLSGDSDFFEESQPQPKIVLGTVNPQGFQRDFLEPGAEETADIHQPSMEDTLLAVTDAVSRVAGSVTTGLVRQNGTDGQSRAGDSRPPGPDSEDDIVPRFERWELEVRAKDIESYSRQLDHYGIELGLIGGSIQGVDYAYDLSTDPKLRRGESESEKRLYLIWQRPSPLMQFDVRLLRRAGAEVQRRQLLKFIPPELEVQLARMELEYAMSRGRAGDSTVESIVKTVFTSQAESGGYRFVVSSQRYRKQKD